jgi:flagellar FliJ protein
MTKWAQSLIRIADFEVETLQKRLSEIVGRRSDAEIRIAVMEAEAQAEADRARTDPEVGLMQIGFIQAFRLRRTEIQTAIDALMVEERGARDALSLAFEELKKFEQVAETARLLAVKQEGQRETAALDELGLRASR